jgi:hypothetical protein
VHGKYHGKFLPVYTNLEGELPEFVSIEGMLYKRGGSLYSLMNQGPEGDNNTDQAFYIIEGHVSPVSVR